METETFLQSDKVGKLRASGGISKDCSFVTAKLGLDGKIETDSHEATDSLFRTGSPQEVSWSGLDLGMTDLDGETEMESHGTWTVTRSSELY